MAYDDSFFEIDGFLQLWGYCTHRNTLERWDCLHAEVFRKGRLAELESFSAAILSGCSSLALAVRLLAQVSCYSGSRHQSSVIECCSDRDSVPVMTAALF